jgi:predicted Zn-dependent protease
MAQSEHSIVAIVTPKLNHRARDRFLFWIQISFCFVFISCSVQAKIPTAVDDRIEDLLLTEAARILAVSEDRDNFSQYQFFLSEFPRQDLLGISVGNRQIYISYKLASRALTDSSQRWLLRQTVAHEIAHETAGHAKQEGAMWLNAGTFTRAASGRTVGLPWYVRLYNYSVAKELEADLKGLGYWNKLGWNCQIWVRILKNFQKQNYSGDRFHPTDRRLQQAQNACGFQRDDRPTAQNSLTEKVN